MMGGVGVAELLAANKAEAAVGKEALDQTEASGRANSRERWNFLGGRSHKKSKGEAQVTPVGGLLVVTSSGGGGGGG
jgi:hypothetical protein